MRDLFFPKGTPLTITSGEYSDFGILAQLVTVKDCDLPALVKEYRAETNSGGSPYDDEPYDFPAWLVVKEYAMPMRTEEVHIGSYGGFSSQLIN